MCAALLAACNPPERWFPQREAAPPPPPPPELRPIPIEGARNPAPWEQAEPICLGRQTKRWDDLVAQGKVMAVVKESAEIELRACLAEYGWTLKPVP